nr:DUF5057 domain-containing protein [Clostridium yunnanense]
MLNDTKWTGVARVGNTGDNKTYVEYYSENDITNKRANEIMQNINSGQLVYIAKEIFTQSATNNSKLYSNFNSLSTNNLIKNVSQTSITLDSIVTKYKDTTMKKRPILTLNSIPAETNSDRLINLTFSLNTDNNESGMKANLYLDLNGDGLFKDKELVKSITNISTSNGEYNNGNIQYTLDDQFVGRLTWKLEIVNSNNVKVYKTGVLDYQAPSNKKPIVRVLQVYPKSNNNLNLSTDSGIQGLIKNLRDYTLTIKSISTTDFNTYLTTHDLNGNYDMLILGFADSYGNDDLPAESIGKIKSFIKTGQSVMFTHDTLTYRYFKTVDVTDKNSKNITHAFKDIIGQSRFIDPDNTSQLDIYQNFNISTGTYENRTIPHDSLNSTDANAGKVSLGLTQGILKQYDTSATAGSYTVESSSVYKINDGLVNQYPFTLGDIGVAPTHYQWYQLNLEDPDIVPWYTLKPNGNGYNQYDARNYYYTYSKGNITYSGTGHKSGYADDEKKLFVNTMVKAERGANHAPTIEVSNLSEEGVKLSRNQENLSFSFIPRDRDNDPINYKVTVKSGNTVLCSTDGANKKQGESIPISFTKEQYIKPGVNTLTVVVEVSDPQGASPIPETRTVYIIDDPTISLSASYDPTGYLVGDEATVAVTATANKSSQDINTTISNIKYDITGKYDQDQVQVTSGGNYLQYNNVIFSPDANNKQQSKEFKFKLNKSGQIAINGKLSYNVKDISTPQTSDYTLNIPVNEGKATINIYTGINSIALGTAKVEVYNKDNVLVNTVDFNGSKFISGITTGVYRFDLVTCPNGYSVTTKSITKTFDYAHNNQSIDFSVSPTATISHGLYTNGNLSTGNVELTKNSGATFGISFTTKDLNPLVTIDLDDNIANVTTDKFKLYRKEANDTLTELTNFNITRFNGNENKFTIQFANSNIDSNYLIQYNVKLGNNDSYTNNVTLNGTSRPITITCQDLQDLF